MVANVGRWLLARRALTALTLPIALALVSGCSNTSASSSNTTTSRNVTTTSTDFVSNTPPGGLGKYSRPAPVGDRGGTTAITLSGNGHYVQDTSDGPVTGWWAYNATQQITFIETSASACNSIPGTYTWTFDGSHLTLTAVTDNCSLRRDDLPVAGYTKTP